MIIRFLDWVLGISAPWETLFFPPMEDVFSVPEKGWTDGHAKWVIRAHPRCETTKGSAKRKKKKETSG